MPAISVWLTVVGQCCIRHLSILRLHDSIVEDPYSCCNTCGEPWSHRGVCKSNFAVAHLICFASIVG